MPSRVWRGAKVVKTSVKKKTTKAPGNFARMSTWMKGMIWGMKLAGMRREDMLEHIVKTDGSPATVKAIDETIAKKKADPDWEGQVHHPGRPHELSEDEKKQVVALVFKDRGQKKRTIPFCKKKLLFLRRVCDQTNLGV